MVSATEFTNAPMHMGARTMNVHSSTASNWRSANGNSTCDTLRACIAAAVPSESTWYVRESSGAGTPRPPSISRLVISR